MKDIKQFIITVAIIIGGIYLVYFAGTQGWLKNTPLAGINYEQLNFLKQDNLEQTKVLSERAKETSEHVQQVLGDKVEVDEKAEDKPLHEKTIEYARYLYCQQVVDEWEGKN